MTAGMRDSRLTRLLGHSVVQPRPDRLTADSCEPYNDDGSRSSTKRTWLTRRFVAAEGITSTAENELNSSAIVGRRGYRLYVGGARRSRVLFRALSSGRVWRDCVASARRTDLGLILASLERCRQTSSAYGSTCSLHVVSTSSESRDLASWTSRHSISCTDSGDRR